MTFLLQVPFLVLASLWRFEFHQIHQCQGIYKLSLALLLFLHVVRDDQFFSNLALLKVALVHVLKPNPIPISSLNTFTILKKLSNSLSSFAYNFKSSM